VIGRWPKGIDFSLFTVLIILRSFAIAEAPASRRHVERCAKRLLHSEKPEEDMKMTTQQLNAFLTDPRTSYWLKEAIKGALKRDPLDASRDADILATLLHQRADEILAQ
jgi:hypothetical protein